MAKRVKKVVHTGITMEQMEQAFADYSKADSMICKVNAELELKITKIREAKAEDLNKLNETRTKAFDILQAYATENKAELFSKKKSIDTVHEIIGFRKGTPKLKTLKKITWAKVTEKLKEFLPDYVRKTEEPAKDLLLSAKDNPEIAEKFPQCGIYVDFDETFFVERKTEETV